MLARILASLVSFLVNWSLASLDRLTSLPRFAPGFIQDLETGIAALSSGYANAG
ncbi:hypothetical protein SLEP1_g60171 [Rubroshorea leprosula]|uniref:Uncharacterized protein n=1 Tax=Rubroshorea leprosula TaxID=152421 RepID=A0AAV5MXG6_9ROSI|nr:hypothetical protein SLEP1_g60171 [Rubroshorea leprosula]